ncbi:MAG: histone deacetylase [Polyangiaceae bacterium]
MSARLVSSIGDSLQLPPGHRFPAGKYERIVETVVARHPDLVVESTRVPWQDLGLCHAASYIAGVRSGELPAAMVRAIGLPWSESMVARSRRSVGGTVSALDWAMREGAAGHLAGGTHHAFADRGAGFCVFNDIAVAIHVARRDHGVERASVIDLDVHQGDGTAALFADDPRVFTLSLHGEKNFPFRKQQGSLDVALPDGCADIEYLRALDVALEQVAPHRPEVLFYQAGVDPLAGDRFGRLALTHDGLRARDARVFALARRLGVPLVVTLGGGYHPDIESTIAAHVAVFEGLVEAYRRS